MLGWRSFLLSLGMVAATTILAAAVHSLLPHANLALVFLIGVLVIAVRAGMIAAALGSALSFLSYNFLFTSPYFTLDVEHEGDVVTLSFFLVASLVAGHLASRVRAESARNLQMVGQLETLNAYTRELAAAPDAQAVDLALAQQQARIAGTTDPDAERLLALVQDLAAVARQRIGLVSALQSAELEAQTERLRSALLSSVSHDLRTPLASIIGATTSLQEFGPKFPAAVRDELLAGILDEASRLNRYIQNLLDMTRLGGGAIRPHCDWVDLQDLLFAAQRRLRRELGQRRLVISLPPALDLLYVQAVLIEQCLVNVLENAIRHTTDHGCIQIRARCDREGVWLDIEDDGPGIASADRERVFEMFYRAESADRGQGHGLGLTICRGLVMAHGGEVEAVEPSEGGGACIRIRLPSAPMSVAA